MPTYRKTVLYNAGTKIHYNNNAQYADRLEIEGPTNMTLKILVSNLIVSDM